LVTTGIEPEKPVIPKTDNNIVIYPVPGSQTISCIFPEPLVKEYQYYMTDQRGVIISQGSIRKGSNKLLLDVREIADGMYFLKIISAANEGVFRKILVKH
jgi:hypothetical protein